MTLAHENNKNDNNYYSVLSNSESNEKDKDFFMGQVVEQIKVNPKIMLNPQVVCAMKNLQALCNKDANKIVEWPAQEKMQKNFK